MHAEYKLKPVLLDGVRLTFDADEVDALLRDLEQIDGLARGYWSTATLAFLDELNYLSERFDGVTEHNLADLDADEASAGEPSDFDDVIRRHEGN